VGNVLSNLALSDYAMFDNGVTSVDGSFKFAPRSLSVTDSYFISNEVSGNDGVFATNPTLLITLEAKYNIVGFNIVFEDPIPSQFIVRTYYGASVVETLTVNDVTESTLVNHKFNGFDKIEIEFVSLSLPNTRVRVKHFEIGEFTDYKITYKDLLATPVGQQLQKVKSVIVNKSIYTLGASKQLYKGAATLGVGNDTLIIRFSTSSTNHAVTFGNYTIQILESSTYYVKFKVQGLTGTVTNDVVITGNVYDISTTLVSKDINTVGIDKTFNNPLISTDQLANNLVEWLGDYYASDKEYSFEYRGDPRLQQNDIFYLENQYNDNLKCRLFSHKLSFDGFI
jgi:hypothetical protein